MRRNDSRFRFGVLLGLSLGKVVLLSGCGSAESASVVAGLSAREYAEGARQIEENNRRHLQAAAAARKSARAKP